MIEEDTLDIPVNIKTLRIRYAHFTFFRTDGYISFSVYIFGYLFGFNIAKAGRNDGS